MPLAAAALLPSMVRHLTNVGSSLQSMTLADLVTVNTPGYDISLGAPKVLTLDFREPTSVTAALASDCGRFSCAAFQSVADIGPYMDERDTFPWALVKLYYAAFYAGHALTRTLGEGCSFFYKKHADRIAAIADANEFAPALRMDAGLYLCVLNTNASAITYTKAASTAGGAHEAFWLAFGNKLKLVAEDILTGPLPRADAQAVYVQINFMLQIISRKTGYSWLSGIRNDLQYRLQHGAWFPERTKVQVRRDLGRIAGQWKRDPMTIDLANRQWGLLGDFSLACAFIVALCREVFVLIATRSSRGNQSFARTGPIAFLSDIGVAP